MSKATFQSGMSWKVVEAPLIRNRRKIEAVVENAQTMLALEREFGSFKRYLASVAPFETASRDLTKRFRFLGPTGAYCFLWVVGEPGPPHEEMIARGQTLSAQPDR